MAKHLSTLWPAHPHTVAKIAILKAYLKAWFRILGTTRPRQTILYVDGFAGPGCYTDHDEGSPLAALRAGQEAISQLGPKFIARCLHCAFIESDPKRFEVLTGVIAPFEGNPSLGITKLRCDFVNGIEQIRKDIPGPFKGEGPLFVFADPFGVTGIPLQTLAECMQGDTAELLINLDADGTGRIFKGESNNNREAQLTALFGTESWRQELTAVGDFKRLTVQILDLYKRRLHDLPGVRFVWSFAMRGSKDALNYYLVFATKHAKGMERMKEAMRAIDKTGSYSFSDAHAEQHVLFRDDDAETYAAALFRQFDGQTVTMEDAHVFALNETPFPNAKAMLAVLEKQELLQVRALAGEIRRAGSFPEDKVAALRFGRFGATNAQGELFQ